MMDVWLSELPQLLGVAPERLAGPLIVALLAVIVIALVELALLVRGASKRRRLREDKAQTDPALRELLDETLRNVPIALDSQNPHDSSADTAVLEKIILLLEKKGFGDASLYLKLAHIAHSRGDLTQALSFAERALEFAERAGNTTHKSYALGAVGIIHKDKNQPDEAFKFLSHALNTAREAKQKDAEARHLRVLGTMYRAKRGSGIDIDLSLEYFQNALAIDQEINDRSGVAQDLDFIGLSYLDKGDLDLALNYFNDALNAHRETTNRRGEARALGNLGMAHQIRGDLDSALRYLNNALMIHEELGNLRGQSQSLGNIGLIYQAKGSLDLALEYHSDALAIDHDTGDTAAEAQDIGAIGMIYYHKGNFTTALKHLREARDLFINSGASGDLETVENVIRELEAQL